MDSSPPPVPPASSWHQSCMCWLRGIFWRLQEKWVALHATILCSPSPRQSFASPVCACASQTRLKQLTSVPPLLIPHLTSQTSEMFGIKEAQILRLVMVPPVIWMILPGIFNGTLMFVMCLYPVLYPNVNVIMIIWFFYVPCSVFPTSSRFSNHLFFLNCPLSDILRTLSESIYLKQCAEPK